MNVVVYRDLRTAIKKCCSVGTRIVVGWLLFSISYLLSFLGKVRRMYSQTWVWSYMGELFALLLDSAHVHWYFFSILFKCHPISSAKEGRTATQSRRSMVMVGYIDDCGHDIQRWVSEKKKKRKRGYKKQIKKRCCPAVPDTCLDKTLKITELLTVSLPHFIICINCSASEREKVKTHIGHPLLDFFCLCGCFVCFPTGILQHLMRTYGLF